MEKVDALLECAVEMGNVAGVVAMVTATGCEPYAGAYGDSSPGEAATMLTDTIFQVSSMVRPILTVAALTLVSPGDWASTIPSARCCRAASATAAGQVHAEQADRVQAVRGSSRCGHC